MLSYGKLIFNCLIHLNDSLVLLIERCKSFRIACPSAIGQFSSRKTYAKCVLREKQKRKTRFWIIQKLLILKTAEFWDLIFKTQRFCNFSIFWNSKTLLFSDSDSRGFGPSPSPRSMVSHETLCLVRPF